MKRETRALAPRVRFLTIVAIALLVSAGATAQTIPLSALSGKVTVGETGVPGVAVTLTSPSLQGTRTTATSAAGDYIFPLLPPGDYTVKFELAGMQTVTRQIPLDAARTDHRLDVELSPTRVAEAVTVTGETPVLAAIDTTQVSTNFKQATIEALPVGRTLTAVTLLAPGANPNGPGGNTIISGAMSFDSLYLINGAVVNENLRGQPHNLFIEDAIQETTVLTGGVPAEYGHFTGGVVSAITKSGGNTWRGSFRTSFTSEIWSEETPLTEAQDSTVNPVYEATLGGPFFRDHLWFFGAGRYAELEDIRQTVPGLGRTGDQFADGTPIPVGTAIPSITYPHSTEETRLEGKLTGTIATGHTLVASYLDIDASEVNQTGQSIMDLRSLVPERETPNTFLVANYSGILTNDFFVEAQYSEKEFQFVGSGSRFFDLVNGTLITDRARGTRYWSPTFRATPAGEKRDIESWTAKATYFLSTPTLGSHEIKLGYEDFNEVRAVNNWQNGSEFRISVPSTIVRGDQIYSRMPGTVGQTRISWLPIFVLSEGSDYTTQSVFLQDRWSLKRLSFNLGVRYDKNDAVSGDGSLQIADDDVFSPRLSGHYDVFGNGRLIVNSSYGQYVGRLAEGAANDADPAGRNATLAWDYRGPNINNTVTAPTSSLIPTDQAIQMVFDWFFANCGDPRSGEFRCPFRTTPSIPGVESVLDPNGLDSPLVKEFTFGLGGAIGTRGYARADLVLRNWDNFYTSYRDTTTGRVSDRFGNQFDRSIIRSDDGIYDRKYTGVHTQFSYRFHPRFNVAGTYAWSRLVGNVTGEDTGSGPLVGVAGEYPEYRQERWNYPMGYLTGDQRHRVRLWAVYELPTPIGEFGLSALQYFDSGTRTSVDGSVDTRPYVTNPGYLTANLPASVSYFFGGRGNLKTDDITRTDLALNYSIRVFGNLELFVQPEVLNVFNEKGVTSFDEEVLTEVDDDETFLPFNPFTDTPVECPQRASAEECRSMGAHFQRGPNFGEPDSEGDFQTPRTFRVSVGVRF